MNRSFHVPPCWPPVLSMGCLILVLAASGHARAVDLPIPSSSTSRRVLLIHSHLPHHSWEDEVLAGVRAELKQAQPPVEIQEECVDVASAAGREAWETVALLFKTKHTIPPPDVILCTSQTCSDFLGQFSPLLFPDIPVITARANTVLPDGSDPSHHVNSVDHRPDVRVTLKLAQAVHPQLQQVVVVADDSPFGTWAVARTREAQGEFPNLAFDYTCTTGALDRDLPYLAALPTHSVVLFLGYQQDVHHNPLPQQTVVSLLAHASNRPTYALHGDQTLGLGVLGADMVPVRAVANHAARQALRMLRGERTTEMPPRLPRSQPHFDHRVMQRFGIRHHDLPSGSKVMFGPLGLNNPYHPWFWVAVAIILALLVLIGVLFLNIIHRWRAEAALRQSEEKYRQMTENMKDIIWQTSPDLVFTYVSSSVTPCTGYLPEEIIGRPLWDVISLKNHPEFRDRIAHRVAQAKQSGKLDSSVYEVLQETKDKRLIWTEVNSSPVFMDGRLVGFQGVTRDISQRKQADLLIKHQAEELRAKNTELQQQYEQIQAQHRELMAFNRQLESAHAQLVESENKNRALLDALPDLMFLFTEDGMFLDYHAQPTDSRLAMPPAVFIHKHVSAVLPPPVAQLTLDRLKAVFSTGHPAVYEYQLEIDGTPKDFESRLVMCGKDRALAIVRDITVRKQAEAQIRDMNQQLEQRVRARTAELEAANKELVTFSYSVSHDLRAPLRSIDGFSLALLEDCGGSLDEVGMGHLKRIRAASQRMGQIIDELLNLSRITRVDMEVKPVDLAHMAREVMADLQATQPERQVEFMAPERLMASGDRALMWIVLTNLLGNAWKFTSRHATARIELGSMERDGLTIYFLRDDGAGFDMAYVGKLFGAFQRLHGVHEFDGVGIGLATVQRVIRRHGGVIWAEGAVEKGATFYFTLGEPEPTVSISAD